MLSSFKYYYVSVMELFSTPKSYFTFMEQLNPWGDSYGTVECYVIFMEQIQNDSFSVALTLMGRLFYKTIM